LDADMSDLTVKTIQEIRCPGEKANVFINTFKPGTDRNVVLYGDKNVYWENSLTEIKEKRFFLSFNSKREARKFYLKAKNIYHEKKILYISGDNGGDYDVKQFFNDVNGVSAKYDGIICTPSVSTGVSIDSKDGRPAFDFVGGCFTHNVNTPNDCIQSLGRVRDTKEIHVFASMVYQDNTKKEDEIISRWGKTHQYDNNQMLKFNGEGIKAVSDPLYEKILINSEILEGKQKTGFGINLVKMLKSDNGYNLSWNIGIESAEGKKMRMEAAQMEDEEYIKMVVASEDISDEEYEDLRRSNRLSLDETFRKTKKELKKFYGINDDKILEETALADNRGKARKIIKLLEIATADNQTLAALTEKEAEKTIPDMKKPFTIRYFYRGILRYCGIDDTLEPTPGKKYNKQEAAGKLGDWVEKNRDVFQGAIALPSKEVFENNPIRYIGQWLGNIGFTQKRFHVGNGYQYAVNQMNTVIKWLFTLRNNSVLYIKSKSERTTEIIPEKRKKPDIPFGNFNSEREEPEHPAYDQSFCDEWSQYFADMVGIGALATWGNPLKS